MNKYYGDKSFWKFGECNTKSNKKDTGLISYTKDASNWIDLYDRNNERSNRFEYEWTDYSRVNYESWYQTSLSLDSIAN